MNLRIPPKRLAAAALYTTLHKKYIVNFLRTTAFFTLVNLMILTLNQALTLNLPFQFFTRLGILTGLLSFVFFQFISGYLYQLESRASVSQGDDFFETMHFESLVLFKGFNNSEIELPKLFERVLKTKRVQFVLGELEVDSNRVKIIIDGIGSENFEKIAALALESAQNSGGAAVSSADLFWGFVKSSPHFEDFVANLELQEADIENMIFWSNKFYDGIFHPKSLTEKLNTRKPGLGQNWSSGYTNTLDRFSSDLTPRESNSFSIEGRQEVVNEIETILTKGSHSNVILVGETGVGKSTLIRGLAKKIFWGESLPALNYMRVVELDVSALIASSKSKADLEGLLIDAFNDAVSAGNVILFIDNIHTIFSGGSKEGTIDATEMVTHYLERSGIKIIGSTNQAAYESYLASKQNIVGYFDKIEVMPTTESQTLRVMAEVGLGFSNFYGVNLRYSAVKEVYRLCKRITSEKEMPGRAVDLLENICTSARNNGLTNINKEVVDLLAEKNLNLPVSEAKFDEKQRLLNLEEEIHKRVVAQEDAVKAVSDALRIARSKVSEKERPIGSFLFLGPTGVGKTELAKAVAESYFGSETAMIRIDMNEYQNREDISRLIGKKITGRDELEGGDLVKKVNEKPFSLVLLDEIEKAHPDILNLFLQLLDEGYITDGIGRKIIFTNTIIVATSNGEAAFIRESVSEKRGYLELKELVLDRLIKGNIFKPELLNRFDGIILFKPLTPTELESIAEIMFEKTISDLKTKGYKIVLEDGLLEKMAQEGYQPEMGARPMRRVFQDRLESFLAKKVLEGSLEKGTEFLVKISDLY